jgi:hypothetical protein
MTPRAPRVLIWGLQVYGMCEKWNHTFIAKQKQNLQTFHNFDYEVEILLLQYILVIVGLKIPFQILDKTITILSIQFLLCILLFPRDFTNTVLLGVNITALHGKAFV